MTAEVTVRVLLIEDSIADTTMIRRLLEQAWSTQCLMTNTDTLEAGCQLALEGFDAVLLDLGLPDSQGAETCKRLIAHAPDLPVVVLTGSDQNELAKQALQFGAQDYLVKGQIDAELLSRSLQYAIERKQISERLRVSQLRYRTLVDASSAIVWAANRQLEFSEANTGWSDFTGQETAELLGRGWINAFHPDDRESLANACDAAVDDGKRLERESRLWHAASQRHRHVKLHAVPLLQNDDVSSIVEWIGEITDLDDQRQQELQLRRARRLASLGTLTAGIAHEINNPIQAAWGSAQAALNYVPDGTSDELQKCLQNVCRSTQRCGDIVDHMLQFARSAPSQRVLRPLDKIVEHSLVFLSDFVTKQDATIKVKCSDPVPEAVINAVEIEQLVINLVQNAIQSSISGVTVTISVEPSPENSGHVRLTVDDDGSGISETIADHVFDPFFTEGEHRGTGLGLTIVHEIVQEHGGTIRLEPVEPHGTRFIVDLPNE